jgi:hypothetical protein
MQLDFTAAVNELGNEATFRIANEARPPSRYLLETVLPEVNMETFHVDGGALTVRPTMAGLTAMDSPYAPGGVVQLSTFLQESAKLSIDVPLNEKSLRELLQLAMRIAAGGGSTTEVVVNNVLNFYEKVVIQSHLDTAEWLRGQALGFGAIDWTFNSKKLEVDYGVPTANKLTARTVAGNTAYSGSSSAFWTDVKAAQRILRYRIRAIILGTDLFNDIIANSVNNIEVVLQTGNVFRIRRLVAREGNTQLSSDARETIDLITYDEEGEKLDPANPGSTIKVPFFPRTKMAFIGEATNDGFRIGQGATDDPLNEVALGYTHIAPTVEGGGRPGRWGRVYTPEGKPYMLKGEAAANLLPVIEVPTKLVIATSELAA